jgi:hypothetical protein
MLQPHHSKLSHRELSHPCREILPTGNSFCGSNLLHTLQSKRFAPADLVSNFVLLNQKSSESLIQFFSLILVTIWFWCLLAAVTIAFGWERNIDTIKARKPETVPKKGTFTP